MHRGRGRGDLKAGDPLVLRYRVLTSDGDLPWKAIARSADEFRKS
ncbi:MAG TPA: hypothetical protein VGR35_02650 [Tepidisphaeraceae bacterium]|nr:hypothetical protein [Tepidisphaeraceae bacterium]